MPPKLPSAQDITRPTPAATRGRPSYSATRQDNTYASANIQAADLSSAGEGMKALAGAADDLRLALEVDRKKKDKFELVQAEAQWARHQLEVEKKYLTDPENDITTLAERKREDLNQGRMAAVSSIGNADNRNAFVGTSDVDMARGDLNTAKQIKQIKDSAEITDLTKKIDNNLIALSETPDENLRKPMEDEIKDAHLRLAQLGVPPASLAQSIIAAEQDIEEGRLNLILGFAERKAAIESSEGHFSAKDKDILHENSVKREISEITEDRDLVNLAERRKQYAKEDTRLGEAVALQERKVIASEAYDRVMTMTDRQKTMFELARVGQLKHSTLQEYRTEVGDDPEELEWVTAMEKLVAGTVVTKTAEERMNYRTELHNIYAAFKKTPIGDNLSSHTENRITDLKRFQLKLAKGYAEGYLVGHEGDQFNQLIPVMQSRIEDTKDLSWFGNRKGYPEDIYHDAYDYVFDFLADNPALDSETARDALLGRIVQTADGKGIHEQEDEDIRAQDIASVGRDIARAYILKLNPDLENMDEWPETVYAKDGTTVIKVPPGLAKAKPTQTVGGPVGGVVDLDFDPATATEAEVDAFLARP